MNYYVCIEKGTVVSVVDYVPNVPDTVKLICINDTEFEALKTDEYSFDPVSERVVRVDSSVLYNRQQNEEKLSFLASTDWKILRHLREKALGVETSISEEEYIALEQERQEAAKSIVN